MFKNKVYDQQILIDQSSKIEIPTRTIIGLRDGGLLQLIGTHNHNLQVSFVVELTLVLLIIYLNTLVFQK